MTAITEARIKEIQRVADLAKGVNVVLDHMEIGETWVAGGIVRDLWAAQVCKVDLGGSGDIDILLINSTEADLQELGSDIAAALQKSGYKAYNTRFDYSYGVSELYPDADDRLYGVMQFKIYTDEGKVEMDILVYEEKYETLEDVLETFNCNINKFWFDENGIGVSTFHPAQPFEYREGDRAKDEERYQKCVERYNMVAAAAHPYQRIGEHEGMSREQVDSQLPC